MHYIYTSADSIQWWLCDEQQRANAITEGKNSPENYTHFYLVHTPYRWLAENVLDNILEGKSIAAIVRSHNVEIIKVH
jgi:hypothetical protein